MSERSYPWWKRWVWWPWLRVWREWSPVMVARRVRWFYQRGWRGWADRDTWGLGDFLAGWLPDALRHLKGTKCGIPMSVFTDDEYELMTRGEHVDDAAASAKWDAIMDSMIAGFEAWNRISDGLYERELGEYPMRHDPERFAASEKLRERDTETWKRGMAAFTEHFGSLWD